MKRHTRGRQRGKCFIVAHTLSGAALQTHNNNNVPIFCVHSHLVRLFVWCVRFHFSYKYRCVSWGEKKCTAYRFTVFDDDGVCSVFFCSLFPLLSTATSVAISAARCVIVVIIICFLFLRARYVSSIHCSFLISIVWVGIYMPHSPYIHQFRFV